MKKDVFLSVLAIVFVGMIAFSSHAAEVMSYTPCKKVSGLKYDTMCQADTINHTGGHSWREYQQAGKYARNWESF